MSTTAEARKTRRELGEEAKALVARAQEIQAKGDDATPEEMEEAIASFKSAGEIRDRLASSVKGMPAAEALSNVLADLGAERNPPRLPGELREKGREEFLKSVLGDAGNDGAYLEPPLSLKAILSLAGELFCRAPATREYISRIAPNGYISQGTSIQTPKFILDARDFAQKAGPEAMKALIYSASSTAGGAFVFSQQRPDIVGEVPAFGRFGVSDLVTRIPVRETDSVEFVQIRSVTNSAAETAQATATSGASGTKPESAMTFARVVTPIKTIAHWIPATSRVISDAPRMRTEIEKFLVRGLDRRMDFQMLQGDGTGDNITGVYSHANTLAQAFTTDILVTARKAITKLQVSWQNGDPNAFVMSPGDWELYDTAQDQEARYYLGGPTARAQPRLWGFPVVPTNAAIDGSPILADWTQAMLFDREQAMISASNSHSDFFIRNMVAILAEARVGFDLRSPEAFVIVDITA